MSFYYWLIIPALFAYAFIAGLTYRLELWWASYCEDGATSGAATDVALAILWPAVLSLYWVLVLLRQITFVLWIAVGNTMIGAPLAWVAGLGAGTTKLPRWEKKIPLAKAQVVQRKR